MKILLTEIFCLRRQKLNVHVVVVFFNVIVANNRLGFSSGRLAVGKGLRRNALTSKQQLPDKWLSSELQIESGADTSAFLLRSHLVTRPEARIRLKIQKLSSEKLNENLTMSLLLRNL